MQHPFRLIAVASLFVALAACSAPDRDRAAAMTLKIYAVPPAQAAQLSQSLGTALGKTANVTVPAPGKLLVYAPAGAQASISAAIDSLGESAHAESAPAQVDLHFWVVDAQTGTGTDDDALKPLTNALDAVRHNVGPLHFQLDQAAAVVTAVGHSGSLRTAGDRTYQHDFAFLVHAAQGNTIDLSLSYGDAGQRGLAQFDTRIDAQSGHYVVLAQAPGACPAAPPGTTAPACPEKPALRLLIVRADRLNPPA